MTITARYASRCATCAQQIHVGEQIEWARGTAARHTECPVDRTPIAADATPRPYAPRYVSRIGRTVCRSCGGPLSAPGSLCDDCQ